MHACMCIHARRYGGVLLGPARFSHINNAARVLLEQEGHGKKRGKAEEKQRAKEGGGGGKKNYKVRR